MTVERYNYINNEISKIRSSERIPDDEMYDYEMKLFADNKNFDEYMEIENGNSRPTTTQDILEEMGDVRYNESKEYN